MIRRMGVLQRCYGVLATGFLLLSPLVGAVQTSSPVETGEPEAATGRTEKKAHVAKQYMVVAANPYASWAGKNVLEKGGSAMDAAVAVQGHADAGRTPVVRHRWWCFYLILGQPEQAAVYL